MQGNIQDAEPIILDAGVARGMMKHTKNNILARSAQAD